MKKFTIILFFCILSLVPSIYPRESFAQNSNQRVVQCVIVLKNNESIKDAWLLEIYPDRIEYEKDGSLHDQMIWKIIRIETEKEIITFDKYQKPLYIKNNLIKKISNNSKQEEKNIEPNPSSLIILSNNVGDEIDRNERDHYRLFPGINGFISAKCFKKAANNYEFKIKYDEETGHVETRHASSLHAPSLHKDTIISINEYSKNYLQKYLFVYEEKLNKNENVDCPICDYLIQRNLVADPDVVDEHARPLQDTLQKDTTSITLPLVMQHDSLGEQIVVKGQAETRHVSSLLDAPSLHTSSGKKIVASPDKNTTSASSKKLIKSNTYLTDEQLFYLGKSEGYRYYKPNEEIMIGACASAGCFPPLGLLTGMGIAASAPKNIHESYESLPNKELSKNQHYSNGYQKGAHYKKITHTATGCLAGTGVFIFGMILISIFSFSLQ